VVVSQIGRQLDSLNAYRAAMEAEGVGLAGEVEMLDAQPVAVRHSWICTRSRCRKASRGGGLA